MLEAAFAGARGAVLVIRCRRCLLLRAPGPVPEMELCQRCLNELRVWSDEETAPGEATILGSA